MREVAKVVIAVGVTDLVLRGVGVWSSVAAYLGKWPWLPGRYALIFPLVMVIAVLALRRWRPARSHLLVAVLSAASAGVIVCLLSLVLAQVITASERANFWNGLRLEGGVTGFLLFGSAIALFRALGWLYGALASVLALIADRAEKYFRHSSGQTESPVRR